MALVPMVVQADTWLDGNPPSSATSHPATSSACVYVRRGKVVLVTPGSALADRYGAGNLQPLNTAYGCGDVADHSQLGN